MLENAQYILDKVMGQITGYANPLNTQQFLEKYAFDVRLPSQVSDATTGQPTWAQSINPSKFITVDNARKRADIDDFMIAKRPLTNLNDVFAAWQETNFTATERQLDSSDVFESDNVYGCDSIYRSTNVHNSKHLLFCDSVLDSEYAVASQRSHNLVYSARCEDSHNCTQSFSVSWSHDVVNSAFIHDCGDMFECLFCSHITNRKYCVANMQLTEEEYWPVKDMVMRWLLGQ